MLPTTRSSEPATCREFIDRLGEYVNEELPDDARHRLDRHLVRCRCCAAYINSYGRTLQLERAAFIEPAIPEPPLPEPPLPEDLVQAILSTRVM